MKYGKLKPPYAPIEVDRIKIAFPAAVEEFVPTWTFDIGDEWERKPEAQTWLRFQRDWFFSGLPGSSVRFVPKEGIDPERAFGHLAAIQRSWEPKHEAKVFAVSFLASQWFERIEDASGELLYGRSE